MGDVLGNNATPAGIRKLRNALFTSHCPNLEDLRMSCNQAGSAAIEFFEVVPLPRKRLNIAHIDFSDNRIDLLDAGIVSVILRGCLEISHLVDLDCIGCLRGTELFVCFYRLPFHFGSLISRFFKIILF
jgi:hypothetical protein